MVSQAILGIRWVLISPFHGSESETSCRTYNIAQRNIWIGRIIGSAYFIATAVRYYCSLPDDWYPQNVLSSSGSLLYTTGKVS
jgi:hypothetical protein